VDPVSAGPEPGGSEPPRMCAWCATPAVSPEATTCTSCGAALAQRESIGDLAIPGLTSVDAALQDFDKRPLHLRGPSPSQGMAPALIIGAMAGGPIGLAAIGGVAAVAAAEFMGTRRDGQGGLDSVGRPSEVVLQAIEHIEDGTLPPSGALAADGGAVDGDAAADDDGRSIWRDLPPTPAFDSPAAPEQDEEVSANGR